MSKLIFELQKWVTGNSVLVVTVRGILLRLYCPFVVECINYTDSIHRGQRCIVSRVGIGSNLELVYIIQGKAYSYKFFKIIGKDLPI